MREKLKTAVLVSLVIFAFFVSNVIALGYMLPKQGSSSLTSQQNAITNSQKTTQASTVNTNTRRNSEGENEAYEYEDDGANTQAQQAQAQQAVQQQAYIPPPQPIRTITRAS